MSSSQHSRLLFLDVCGQTVLFLLNQNSLGMLEVCLLRISKYLFQDAVSSNVIIARMMMIPSESSNEQLDVFYEICLSNLSVLISYI